MWAAKYRSILFLSTWNKLFIFCCVRYDLPCLTLVSNLNEGVESNVVFNQVRCIKSLISNLSLLNAHPKNLETKPSILFPENSVVTEYQSLGCWADTKEWRKSIMRAIRSMEGLHPSLNDDYKKRSNPITKCAAAAKAYGYKVFAVQNGGQCFADPLAEKTYTTYGPSTQCRFGVGGALANDVYRLP